MRSHVTYETPRVFGQTAWRNNGFNAGLLRASSGSADLLAAPLPQVTSPQRNDSGSTFLQSSADHMEGRVVEETKNQRSIELNHAQKTKLKVYTFTRPEGCTLGSGGPCHASHTV